MTHEPSTSPARAPQGAIAVRVPERPPGWAGPAVVAVSVGLGALSVAVGGAFGVGGFTVLVLVAILGAGECVRALDGWLMSKQVYGDVVVQRTFAGRATLLFASIGAVAARERRSFAVVDANIWEVRARAAVDVDATIERRGLLTLGGVLIEDPGFDRSFVVRTKDIAPAHLARIITVPARAAIARLFLHGRLRTVSVTMDGTVELQLEGRATASEVAACAPALAELIAAFGARGDVVGGVRTLVRGHSPDGNPVSS